MNTEPLAKIIAAKKATPTWGEIAIAVLEEHGAMTATQFSAITNLHFDRARTLLGKLAAYGKISVIQRYVGHPARPELRRSTIYGPQDPALKEKLERARLALRQQAEANKAA